MTVASPREARFRYVLVLCRNLDSGSKVQRVCHLSLHRVWQARRSTCACGSGSPLLPPSLRLAFRLSWTWCVSH